MKALDGIRGAAILAVVAFHTTIMATRGAEWATNSPPPAVLWPLFIGKLGVDVFFVLSGFLVLRSWRTLRDDLPHEQAVWAFTRRRARRILPAYWFSLFLLVPLRVPHWLTSFDGLQNIVVFASVQQFLDPTLPHRLNVVTWSLTTEVHFYVLLPALAYAVARYGLPRVLPAVVVLCIGWRLWHGGTGEEAEWIVGRLDQFTAGMAAAVIADRVASGERIAWVERLRSRWAGAAMAALALAVAAPLGVMQLLPKPLAYQATFHTVIGLLIAAWLVRGTSGAFPRLFEARPLRILGDTSYSLYLWHWPILIEASARWGPSAPVLSGALGVTAVMTAITYVLFERPFIRSRRVQAATDGLTRTPSSAASVGRPAEARR